MNHYVEFERLLVRAAFLEWRVAKAYSTGHTMEIEPRRPRGQLIRSPVLSDSWPSKGWLDNELGGGPWFAEWCRTLARTNRRAVVQLGTEAPYRFTYPKVRN